MVSTTDMDYLITTKDGWSTDFKMMELNMMHQGVYLINDCYVVSLKAFRIAQLVAIAAP